MDRMVTPFQYDFPKAVDGSRLMSGRLKARGALQV
jgi:hypothetical protein